jgi:ABC-type sugar transport system permease subunit
VTQQVVESTPTGVARERGTGRAAARALRRRARRRQRWPYLYMVPALLLVTGVFLYPLAEVVRMSLYATGNGPSIWVGLENYRSIFSDPIFLKSVGNNLKLLLVVPCVTVAALAIAMALYRQIRGWRAYRTLVFVPYVLPASVMGLVFSYLLSGRGVLNQTLRSIGLGPLALNWLGDPDVVLFTIAGTVIWGQLGFGVMVFTAGLLAVPAETVEAARLDGASWRRIRLSILLPQIRRPIELFVVIECITMISFVFAYVLVLTGGGPANASSVVDFYIYTSGFQQGTLGIAAAASVVLLGMASVVIALYLKLRSERLAV